MIACKQNRRTTWACVHWHASGSRWRTVTELNFTQLIVTVLAWELHSILPGTVIIIMAVIHFVSSNVKCSVWWQSCGHWSACKSATVQVWGSEPVVFALFSRPYSSHTISGMILLPFRCGVVSQYINMSRQGFSIIVLIMSFWCLISVATSAPQSFAVRQVYRMTLQTLHCAINFRLFCKPLGSVWWDFCSNRGSKPLYHESSELHFSGISLIGGTCTDLNSSLLLGLQGGFIFQSVYNAFHDEGGYTEHCCLELIDTVCLWCVCVCGHSFIHLTIHSCIQILFIHPFIHIFIHSCFWPQPS